MKFILQLLVLAAFVMPVLAHAEQETTPASQGLNAPQDGQLVAAKKKKKKKSKKKKKKHSADS